MNSPEPPSAKKAPAPGKFPTGYWARDAQYGGVSGAAKSVSIGCTVRLTKDDDLTKLMNMLCNSRLSCILRGDPSGKADVQGQGRMVDTDLEDLEATTEVTGFSVKAGQITLRLNFADGDVSLDEIGHLRFAPGIVALKRLGGKGSGQKTSSKTRATSD
jgi:hypothetical protein